MTSARSRARIRAARITETVMKGVTGSAAALVVTSAVALLGYLLVRGLPSISWEFLTGMPRTFMTQGGIWPAIVGTFWLTLGTAVFALPVGIAAGIYLSEYAPRSRGTRLVRLSIANMSGVPSIVYALFGVALFVSLMGLKVSIVAGSLTLACLTLPVIITATEEALRQVPQDLRQAALALGATRWRTIRTVVLPAAAPGIVTGSILGLSRAAGETAPILFTAAFFMAPLPKTPMDKVMALPTHIYIMATQPMKPAPHIVWGAALVLVAGVSIVNIAAATWRARARRKVTW
ncbi:MAG: phosphate ABC transporter permease PstA [Coriobacteriia bacterium]|nr:phosphate ABC transporter permease PstA [Coriobacteriia bacterium]